MTKNRSSGAFVMLMLFATRVSVAGSVDVAHKYIGDDGETTTISVFSNPRRLSLSHPTHPMKLSICDSESTPKCIRSDSWEFALPSAELQVDLTWQTDTHKYSVVRKRCLMLGGRTYHVWEIIAEDRKFLEIDSYFFYSKKSGLVGFSIPTMDVAFDAKTGRQIDAIVSKSFWLSSARGLFSPSL